MHESMKTRPTCAIVFASASLKRVFCISSSVLPNALRSRAYAVVSSTARSMTATPVSATSVRS